MRALAVLACLIACQPAQAFVRVVAGHGGGYHHGGFGHRGSGLVMPGTGYWGPFAAPPAPVAPPPVVEVAPAPVPVVIAAPFPLTPLPAAQAPQRKRGPHIIYIGHKPEISGPKVIYGTE